MKLPAQTDLKQHGGIRTHSIETFPADVLHIKAGWSVTEMITLELISAFEFNMKRRNSVTFAHHRAIRFGSV